MSELSPKEKITKAKVQLQKESPFFSYLVMNMKIKKDDENTQTVGIDPRGNLYYNPDFVEELTDEQTQGVLCHETLHIVLETTLRRDGRDRFLWNLASDFVINEKVKRSGFVLPSEVAYNSKYSDMCAEKVYSDLRDELPDPPKGGGEGGESGGGVQGQGRTESGEGKECEQKRGKSEERKEYERVIESEVGKQFDDHKELEEDGVEKSGRKAIEEEWERKVVEAYQHSQRRGEAPRGMHTVIDGFLNRELDWRSILRKYVKKEVPCDFTYASPHKKSKAIGFYMPDVKRESLEVVAVVDTSGSISNEMLQQFLGEVKGIAKSHESVRMTFIQADAQIQDTFELKNRNMSKLDNMEMKGRGGTDHRPVFDWVQKNKPNARILVALTDGFTSFPDKPTVRNVLWVVPESGADRGKFPFGKVIQLPNIGG